MQKRTVPILIEKSNSPDFDAKFTLSHSSADRVKDTIEPSAYTKVASSVQKLVALFNHDHDKIVGYWSDLKALKDSLTGQIRFFHKDWGAMVKEMLDFGIPLGASIGFMGRGEYNKDSGGYHFKEIEIFETSIVAVPAHPRAIEIAKSFGFELSEVQPDDIALSAMSGTFPDPAATLKNAKAAILHANKTVRFRS